MTNFLPQKRMDAVRVTRPQHQNKTEGKMARFIREEKTWNRKHFQCPVFRNHCRLLTKVFRNKSAFIERIREPSARLFEAIEIRSEMFTDPVQKQLNVHVFVRIAGYEADWIRQPESWKPMAGMSVKEQFHALIAHLFCVYEMPRFFDSIWLEIGSLYTNERDLFCDLATGASLKKLAEHHQFTKKSAHWMMQAPDEFTVKQATQWGRVRALGGDESLALSVVIACSRDSLPNIVTDRCWNRFLQLCVHSKQDLSVSEIEMLVDYLSYSKAEHTRHGKVFNLEKLGIDVLLQRSQSMWSSLVEMAKKAGLMQTVDLSNRNTRKEIMHLARFQWRNFHGVENLSHATWRIYEYCSMAELAMEGREMNNCVKSYADRCYHGSCSIWTLRRVEKGKLKPAATIAVDRVSRKITEARGNANRNLRNEERLVIQTWAKDNKLIWKQSDE